MSMSPEHTAMIEVRSASEAVVRAIAEAADVDPIEITPPLYEAIDPDALDRLFNDASTIEKVAFRYNGHDVTVFAGGNVSVERPSE